MQKNSKIFIFILMSCLLMIPIKSYASENGYEETIVAEKTKYYKTITHKNNNLVVFSNFNGANNSKTIEITKEEYDSSSLNITNLKSTTIETTYKKMTTYIISINSYYRYKVILEWKNMPSTRSYDTIAIGFPASVKAKSSPIFSNDYCVTSSNCHTATGYQYSYNSTNGIGITFQVPTGSLYSMKQTLYFDVGKNTSSTIVKQYAYGDYSHATKNVSLTKAKSYSVGSTGIVHNNDSIQYYDQINVATAEWSGTW